jgi:cytochrome c-type biogenesis protein CcmF
VRQLVLAARRQGWRGLVGRANGGMVVHLGVIMIAVAAAASSSYVRQGEFTLAPGESVEFAGHTLQFEGLTVEERPEKVVTQAQVLVDGTGPWGPAINQFLEGNQSIGTPSVRTTATHDVALTLLALPDGETDSATIRVTIQPLIVWLWIGGGVMAVGTLLSVFPGRRRRPTDPVSAPVGDAAPVVAPATTGAAAGPVVRDAEPDAEPVGAGGRPTSVRPASGPEGDR